MLPETRCLCEDHGPLGTAHLNHDVLRPEAPPLTQVAYALVPADVHEVADKYFSPGVLPHLLQRLTHSRLFTYAHRAVRVSP